jgi:hypothetical protein
LRKKNKDIIMTFKEKVDVILVFEFSDEHLFRVEVKKFS